MANDGILAVVVTTSSARVARLVVSADGNLLPALYEAIGCHLVDVVRLGDDLDMWIDDEGLLASEPQLNPGASFVAAVCGFDHQPYCGVVVFTGGANKHGETLSIGPDLAGQVREVATLGIERYADWEQRTADVRGPGNENPGGRS